MKDKKFLILIILAILLSINSVNADNDTDNQVWISADGTGSGNSIEDPTNIENAITNVKQNEVINFLDGTYVCREYMITKGNVTLQAVNSGNVIITSNNANEVFRLLGPSIKVYGITFKSCAAYSYGGAIDWQGRYGILNDCTFEKNEASSGGAIFWPGEYGTIINCTFKENSAGGAGAIHWSGSDGKIINSTFMGNIASASDGGAIHWSAANGIIENCLFIKNKAPKYIGGAIYWSGLNGKFINNVFIDNNDRNGYQLHNLNEVSFINNTFNTFKAIYNKGIINSDLKVIILNNQTKQSSLSSNFKITAIITDDNGNRIGGQNLTFLIENNSYSITANNDVVYSMIYEINQNKTIVSADYLYGSNVSIFNGTIITDLLKASDIIMYYANGTKYEITSPIDSGNISIEINGAKYVKEIKEGIANLGIWLNPGVYNITATYENFTIHNTVKVIPTIVSQNIVKIFRNNSQFNVKVLSKTGQAVKNSSVLFNINGMLYNKSTNNEGIATLNIYLNQGNYIITTKAEDGCLVSNNITVLSRLIENNNLIKYYINDSQYKVKLLDGDGNPLKGKTVTFNINGLFYNRTTDETGFATLNIYLIPNEYIVTAMYDSCFVSNKITVLKTIESENIVMTTNSRVPFIVKVLNGTGKPLASGNIIFNINGMLYNKTIINGSVKLDIHLKVGNYIITTLFNGLFVSNTITIKES